jgi:hypothetical protein
VLQSGSGGLQHWKRTATPTLADLGIPSQSGTSVAEKGSTDMDFAAEFGDGHRRFRVTHGEGSVGNVTLAPWFIGASPSYSVIVEELPYLENIFGRAVAGGRRCEQGWRQQSIELNHSEWCKVCGIFFSCLTVGEGEL